MEPCNLAVAACGEIEPRPVGGANEVGGHQQNLLTQGVEGSILELRWQAEALEPVEQIVGEQKQVEVGFVGEEMMAGNAPECIISLELANDQLNAARSL